MKTLRIILCISLFVFVCGCHGGHTIAPIWVLIFSGQNNHRWAETTPIMQNILRESGSFIVDITEHPEQCTAETFQGYEVIVSNWNSFDKKGVQSWPVETQEAFLDFIRSGGGHVTVHAGGCSFYDWPEYHNIAASWEQGKTSHGPIHFFEAVTSREHPIVCGLDSFWIRDELWSHTAVPANSEILMTAFSSPEWKGSGRNEPVLLVCRYGKGRCVNLILGDNKTVMSNPGWQSLLVRSTEWAGTGKATIPWKENIPIRKHEEESK